MGRVLGERGRRLASVSGFAGWRQSLHECSPQGSSFLRLEAEVFPFISVSPRFDPHFWIHFCPFFFIPSEQTHAGVGGARIKGKYHNSHTNVAINIYLCTVYSAKLQKCRK
ncbi:Hypothetical predicted protein [Cloeon dipterum]|uniref:Uncharacterized protein n=1 Tax=Cloeon dipterum TaxID=197152 RepID=A0A8S1E499_9INSE|nr:Hypothetical predicted protein [Cloeon dipterum]